MSSYIISIQILTSFFLTLQFNVRLSTAQKKVVDLSDSQNEKALAGKKKWIGLRVFCCVSYLTGGWICLLDVILFLLYSKDGWEEEEMEDNTLILDQVQNITFSIKSSLFVIYGNQGCWSFKTSKRKFFFVRSVFETNTLLENKTCDADSHCFPFSFRFSENDDNWFMK